MNLRQHARGKPCQIRLNGICSYDVAETHLAHLRMAGITGMGMKAPDLLGSWACAACARATENGYAKDLDTKLAFFEGVMRTQDQLISDGILTW